MGTPEKKTFFALSQEEWKKVVVSAAVIGAAWGRFEYRSDLSEERIMHSINTHIIIDRAEKEMMKYRHDELDKTVKLLSVQREKLNDQGNQSR